MVPLFTSNAELVVSVSSLVLNCMHYSLAYYQALRNPFQRVARDP